VEEYPQEVSVIEAVETTRSSVDLLLISLDKMTNWVKTTYLPYPETEHRLLGEIALLDNVLTNIKQNADNIMAVDERCCAPNNPVKES
jgi:hypothetical protein